MESRALRIWLVSQSYLPYYGGITEHVWHMAERFAARGHHVRILTGNPVGNGHCAPDPDPAGVQVTRVGHTLRVPSNGARACVTFGRNLGSRIELSYNELPHIVHVQSPLEPFLPLWALHHLPGIKIGTFHTGGRRTHWGYRHFSRWLREPAGKLTVRLAVSREAARFVSQHFPGDYQIMPNGVDLARFMPPGRRETPARESVGRGELRLLSVGRLDPRKGLDRVIAAVAALHQTLPRPLRLVVVGDGPERGHLGRCAQQAGLPVTFAGRVSRAELPRFYREADLLLAPSTDGESFGVSLLEAMAAGLPIVAAGIDGYRETLRDSGAALLYAPLSARDLTAALRALLSDPPRRREMGARGRAYVARFDWDLIASRVEEVYWEALVGSAPTAPIALAGSTARS